MSRKDGVTEETLYMLSVWRETSLFSAREKAALEWAEAVTLLAGIGVPDEVFRSARAEFSEQELAALTLTVGMINLWARLAVSAQMPA